MTSYDPTYPLFPIFSFLACFLSLVPLPWHAQAWNSGTCAYMIWTAVACLNSFINSIVWRGHAENIAPVWCDISSKIIIGASVGIPASILCITRRLYTLTAVQAVSITRHDKQRMVLVDLIIAVVIPAITMILHYVVQGHRFDVLGQVGCYPVVHNSLPAYFLYFMWPLVFGVISFVYSGLTLRFFWLRRAQFASLFSSSSNITSSRYLRLMLLALTDMLCTVPLGVFTLYIGVKDVGLCPWISWEETHYNFSRVVTTPAEVWRSDLNSEVSVEFTRWLPVVCGFMFFALFGFAAEAKKAYSKIFSGAMARLGLDRKPAEKPKDVLPSWVKPFKTGTKASRLSPTSTGGTMVAIPRKPPPTFTSSTTSFSTDVHSYPYSNNRDVENFAYPASSLTSLPSQAQAPPPGVSLDARRCAQPDLQPSSTTSSDGAMFPVAQETVHEANPPLRWRISLESISSVERNFMEAFDRHFPPSPPPFSSVAAPAPHGPLSASLECPEVSAHPRSATVYEPSSEGIVVTIQKSSTTSPALPSRSQFH
uniref:Putative transmembrane pheromone receptor n=1 Tax=Coprinellus disseminatus TaxID=71703 RepID=Q6JZX9_COPDI|nr:putative transmembrane pheromone receptor [Coprinellus disseminatus]